MPKANVNVKIDTDIKELATLFLERNPKRIRLEADEAGNVLLDKKLHPDIYDWAENG